MKIAIIGSGASGMVTAYLLNKKGHNVTVFEKQPILGGHIRTLNKNVKSHKIESNQLLEAGVLEFPDNFYNFRELMKELDVELEPVELGSAIFWQNGHQLFSGLMIQNNFTGIQRVIEQLKLNTLYASSAALWIRSHFSQKQDLYNQSLSQYLNCQSIRNDWIKLLTMYCYSIPFEFIDNVPAELVIPVLQDYVFVKWLRIKGGVYSYIEKIRERFQGEILLNVDVAEIYRQFDSIQIKLSDGANYLFDKVVFATPPDQVMQLLSDPTKNEIKWFSAWQKNQAQTVLHTDSSMYARYGIKEYSEFDFFQTHKGWGYNAYLNRLCAISLSPSYSLAFKLDHLIAEDKIIHIQEHHTPLYTVESFRYRNEIVMTNGDNNTYHAGAYLGNGLHEGAITSAIRVAELIG